MRMMNRVFGVIGIKSIMSNWNADFTGQPRTTGNGEVYATPGALTFTMKKYWESQNEKVLYIKSYKYSKSNKNEKEKMQPKSFAERYEELFNNENIKEQSTKKVLSNLFSAIDVINFGATVAEAGQNISLTGVVQINQGFNKYKNTELILQNIQSPFRNSSLDEANAATLGTKIFTDEAHYFYSFSINPQEYIKYIEVIENFGGYTIEAYQKFKEAALISATVYQSSTKVGCENEFALFIECNDDSKIYLSNLAQYITFNKGKEKDQIDVTGLTFLKDERMKKDIDKIEVYYNPYTTTIKIDFDAIKYNIVTKEKLQ